MPSPSTWRADLAKKSPRPAPDDDDDFSDLDPGTDENNEETSAPEAGGGKRVIWSHGVCFPKNLNILRPRIRQALRANTYERKETDAVLRIVKADDRVIELGGGIGYMSSVIAKRCGAEVHSFEGNPGLIPYIREVHAANGLTGKAHITHALIGPRKSSANFYVRGNILASSMEEMESMPHTEVAKVDVLNAKTTFDKIKPTVLVCDIEGAEAHLIPQLPLDGLRAAVIELHPQWIGQAGVQAVFDAFHAAGLTYFPKASEAKVVTFLKGW